MSRPAFTLALALAASPAPAATLLSGFIEECRLAPSAAYQSIEMGRIAPNVALADCAVAGLPPNPYEFSLAMLAKAGLEPDPEFEALWLRPESLLFVTSGPVPVVTSPPRRTVSLPPFPPRPPICWHCGPGSKPPPEPSTPVPLPAAGLLLLAALAVLALLRRHHDGE